MSIEDPEIQAKREALKPRLRDSNVSDVSFLATDYLNHFNEVLMLFEMCADMPDMLDELLEWKPKSYQDHFKDSFIADKDIAIEAYEISPSEYKKPFDSMTGHMNQIILSALEKALALRDADKLDELAVFIASTMKRLYRAQDAMNAIIHGDSGHLNQENIDSILIE